MREFGGALSAALPSSKPVSIPAEYIERARATLVEIVIDAHGVRLRRAGAERVGPCPICGGTDRFSINTKKQVFNCRGCGAKGGAIDLEMFLSGSSFADAVERLSGGQGRPSSAPGRLHSTSPQEPSQRPSVGDDEDRRALASARRIVAELAPVLGSPGEAYLRDIRRIDTAAIADILEHVDAIGWNPAVYFNEPGNPLHGQRPGCIVGVMTDPVTAAPTGAISRTYIHNGRKIGKAKTLGRPVGIVRLTPDDEVLGGLHLSEGLETALAAMSIGLRPMWSTGSSGVLAAFPVLPAIEAVTVIVDHDARSGAGEKSARECEARWRAAGQEVALLMSDAPGDLNDTIIGGTK